VFETLGVALAFVVGDRVGSVDGKEVRNDESISQKAYTDTLVRIACGEECLLLVLQQLIDTVVDVLSIGNRVQLDDATVLAKNAGRP
jgi:hypothetical protein